MKDKTDQQLLRDYAENHSETAFAELVRRHIGLVHSAAQRMTGESHSSEDVTQAVFVELAQNATLLASHPVLSGWLHTTARYLAAKTVRAAVRRQLREQESFAMNQLPSAENDTPWDQVAPHLDACLGELSESERDALLLRYFEKKSAAEIGTLLGISDAAAQKRVNRAVERLRQFFTRRGVTVGAAGLAVLLSSNAVLAVPAGLAVTVSAAALVGTAVSKFTVISATTKAIAMTTLQKTIVTATVALLAGAGIYEARQVKRLRADSQLLQQQQEAQIQQLQSERDNATNRMEGLRQATEQLRSSDAQKELLKLRGDLAVLRRQAGDATQRLHLAEVKLATELSAEEQFTTHEKATVNAGKRLGMAMRVFATENNDQYPTNFTQIKKELEDSFTIDGIDVFCFEFVNEGLGEQGGPNMIALRERISRQAPDGRWKRIYLFSDGSVQTATSNDGNFDAWEKQNTVVAEPNQASVENR